MVGLAARYGWDACNRQRTPSFRGAEDNGLSVVSRTFNCYPSNGRASADSRDRRKDYDSSQTPFDDGRTTAGGDGGCVQQSTCQMFSDLPPLAQPATVSSCGTNPLHDGGSCQLSNLSFTHPRKAFLAAIWVRLPMLHACKARYFLFRIRLLHALT
jgi:hypothetical protein